MTDQPGIDPVEISAGRLHLRPWVAADALGVFAVSRWAFDALDLHRIELCHSISNPASCRVAEKAGYRMEGLLRGSFRYADGWHDEHLHSRVADDATATEGAG